MSLPPDRSNGFACCCTGLPSTWIARNGRAGQTYSQPPHPTQISGSIDGMVSPSFVGIDDAIFLNEYDAPHLRQVLLLDGKRMDRPVRTYVRADGTVEIAESAVEIHYRLHYPAESVFGYARFPYVRRAFGDT